MPCYNLFYVHYPPLDAAVTLAADADGAGGVFSNLAFESSNGAVLAVVMEGSGSGEAAGEAGDAEAVLLEGLVDGASGEGTGTYS